MNKFRFEEMLVEFPFLSVVINGLDLGANDIDSMKVQRLDANFLKRILADHCYDGSAGQSITKDSLWAVMPDRKVVKVEVAYDFSIGSTYAYSQSQKKSGEPILTALLGLEAATHLVLYERELHDWSGQELVNERRFIVYKASRSTSISEEIEKAREAAAREVRIEADF